MIDESWQKLEVTDFRGPRTLLDSADIPPGAALLARNVRYALSQVATRPGFAQLWNPNDAITSMFNWVFTDPVTGYKNYLLYFKSGYGIRIVTNLTTPVAANVYAVTAYGAVFAYAGQRVYIAHYATSGLGVDHGRVYTYGFGEDTLFARPMLTTEVSIGTALGAGGTLTQGTHKLGFIMTTRSGFTGRPAPVNASLILQPTSVAVGATNKTMTVTLTPAATWPIYGGTLQLIMTTTSNLARYYLVPNTVAAVPAGGGIAINITFDISDDDLALTGVDATKYFALLTQDASNNAPFSPHCVREVGNRMAYAFKNSSYGQGVFISEPNNYQAISADQHIYFLPGQREVVSMFYLDGAIFLLGPHWTYATSDNGDVPVTWQAPQLIDGSVGTLSPEGVCVNVAYGMAWVASVPGLYRFQNGHYDPLPISYYQTEWARINWAVGYTVRVIDHPVTKEVRVNVPLKTTGRVNTNGTAVTFVSGEDFAPSWVNGTSITINGVVYTIASVTSTLALALTGSAGTQTNVAYSVTPTYPTHILKWSYAEGFKSAPDKFSLDYFNGGYNPASMVIFQNDSTKKLELLVGPAQAGAVGRETEGVNETNSYRDFATAIDSPYEMSIMPPVLSRDMSIVQHHGAEWRVSGVGSFAITAYSLDRADSRALAAITLATAPGRTYFRGLRMNSEGKSYRVSNGNTLDSYFILSMIRDYFTDYARQR